MLFRSYIIPRLGASSHCYFHQISHSIFEILTNVGFKIHFIFILFSVFYNTRPSRYHQSQPRFKQHRSSMFPILVQYSFRSKILTTTDFALQPRILLAHLNQHQYNNMHRKASVKEDAFIKLIKFAVTSGININRGASYRIL